MDSVVLGTLFSNAENSTTLLENVCGKEEVDTFWTRVHKCLAYWRVHFGWSGKVSVSLPSAKHQEKLKTGIALQLRNREGQRIYHSADG